MVQSLGLGQAGRETEKRDKCSRIVPIVVRDKLWLGWLSRWKHSLPSLMAEFSSWDPHKRGENWLLKLSSDLGHVSTPLK